MIKKIITTIFIAVIFTPLFSQITDAGENGYILRSRIYNGDTIPHINIREIVILPPLEFESKREYRRYTRLVKNLKKVLPYAKLARLKLDELEAKLADVESEKEQKRLINQTDKELRDEYEEELKKLTITQGRLLIKLIDRETGETSYYLVKELKGSFSAFLWQSLARLFGSNLKAQYEGKGEDALIEDILIRIENGQL